MVDWTASWLDSTGTDGREARQAQGTSPMVKGMNVDVKLMVWFDDEDDDDDDDNDDDDD